MKNLKDNVIVITGAASGMGRELAIQLAQQNCNLALCDINEMELQKTVSLIKNGSIKIKTDVLNVADEKAVYAYADSVIKHFGHVDRVINNAGKVVTDTLNDVSLDNFRLIMDINFWGVVYGTKAFLPHLLKRPDATIVNISSVNAFIPFPNNGPYNCSKYAVCGLNESLHQELAKTNVKVLSVHPGGIRTNIVRNATFIKGANPTHSHEKSANFFEKIAGTSAEKAAGKIIIAFRKDKKRLLIGADAYFFEYTKRLFPKFAVSLIGKLASR
jgi:short-subunit dehydrogenase